MKAPSPPQAVVFDLDGTLVDRPASIRKYAERFQADFGSELSSFDIGHIVSVLVKADGHGYRSEARPATIVDELLKGVDAQIVDAHWRKHFPGSAVAAQMADEVITDLRQRNIAIGLVTNGSVAAQTAKLEVLGWTDVFPYPVISGAYDYKKPDRRIFENAINQIGVAAKHAWFVGDHPINDVWGADQLGMRGFLLPGGPPWPAGHAICGTEIESLSELLRYLEG